MPAWLPPVASANNNNSSNSNNCLRNDYYLLRHGQSTSNVQGIISSDRRLAYSETHGLTIPTGYDQGVAAAEALLALLGDNSDNNSDNGSSTPDTDTQASPPRQVVFISSPFARARQTAQACLGGLQQAPARLTELGVAVTDEVVLVDELVERHFGRLDGDELFTYAYVWPLDQFDVTHTAFDVESVAAVCTRMRRCITQLEERYQNAHLVLVSHADVLQITQLYAARAPNVGDFSSYRFVNGEVRRMGGSMEDLPDPSPLPPPQRGAFIP
jgi:broad specificity phosphatase PhoE